MLQIKGKIFNQAESKWLLEPLTLAEKHVGRCPVAGCALQVVVAACCATLGEEVKPPQRSRPLFHKVS